MEFSVSLFFPRPGWGKSKLASKLLCRVIGLRAMQTNSAVSVTGELQVT